MRALRLYRPQRALLTGLALSLVVHVGTLLVFGRAPLGAFLAAAAAASAQPIPDPTKPKPPDSPLAEVEDLRLGIADSDAVTVNWIGFATPTEHKAEQGSTDQPALAINAGKPATETAPTPSTPPEPAPQPKLDREVAPPHPPALQDKPVQPPAQEAIDGFLAEVSPVIERLLSAAATAMATPLRPPATDGQAGTGDPGEQSDRDSDPTALAGTVDVVPGHPAAHKGLEIKTVRPKWLTLTKMTTTPDNPIVIIKFRRNGTVSEADFEAGRGTGFRSVDGPLLDAVYAWRASGKALDRIPANDPNATLEVRIRVIMR